MKMIRKFLLAAGLVTAMEAAGAQTLTQQSPTQLNAGSVCQAVGTPAVNTQNTLTFTVPAGQYLYLTSVYLSVEADSTGTTAVALQRFTTTNLQSLEWDFSFAGVVNTNFVVANYANPAGIAKSAIGPVSVTIVSPAAAAHDAFPMNACGYFAP